MWVARGLTRDEAETALRMVQRRHPALGWSITHEANGGDEGHALVLADEDALGMEEVVAEEALRVRSPRQKFLDGMQRVARALDARPRDGTLDPKGPWVREIELALEFHLGAPLGPSFDGFITKEMYPIPGGVVLRGISWIFTTGSDEISEPFELEVAKDETGGFACFELRCGRPATIKQAKLARADEDRTVYGLHVRVRTDDEAPWAFELSRGRAGTKKA